MILIVLDTVGRRPPQPLRLRPSHQSDARRAGRPGIRFERAQATASWTLPSHASLFTGRWPHELSASWLTPLDATYPTLAEFLGSRGYATAGFIANTWYCGADSGSGTRLYRCTRIIPSPGSRALKIGVLVDRPLEALRAIESFLEDWLDFDLLGPAVDDFWRLMKVDRKETTEVHREFLDWLSRRRQPERPFFAFLNFFDAHHPFQLPAKALHRFGAEPRTTREATLLAELAR